MFSAIHPPPAHPWDVWRKDLGNAPEVCQDHGDPDLRGDCHLSRSADSQ